MMTVCNGDAEQSGTSYSAVTLVVEERHEESAEDMHIPAIGGEQGQYFDGIDLIEVATVVSCVVRSGRMILG
jgi:hypothetical protein